MQEFLASIAEMASHMSIGEIRGASYAITEWLFNSINFNDSSDSALNSLDGDALAVARNAIHRSIEAGDTQYAASAVSTLWACVAEDKFFVDEGKYEFFVDEG